MKKRKLLAATMMAAGLLASSAAYAETTEVSTWGDLKTGLTNGGDFKAVGNITGADSVSVTSKTNALNLDGKTLSAGEGTTGMTFNGGSLTLTGGGKISGFYNPDTAPSKVDGTEYGIIDSRNSSVLKMTGGEWEFSNNKSGVGSINTLNSSISANVDKIVFDGNISNAQGAALRHQISDNAYIENSASIVANEIVFNNNKIETIGDFGAVVGGGGAVMNSGGTMELLGSTNTFTNNKMNATIADNRKYKVGGGAVINQSHQMGKDGPAINSTMVIGKADGSSTNTFTGNTSSTSGGAVMNRAVDEDGNATLTINGNTTFENNTATQNGGAIYNVQRGTGRTATVNLNNGSYTFKGNTATKDGGAIYNEGTINIKDSTFENNGARYGGAIENSGTLTADNLTFSKNNSTGGMGGAIDNYNGNITIKNSKFSENTSEEGGAIFTEGGSISIKDSTFESNKSTKYGSALRMNNGANVTITGSEFNKNIGEGNSSLAAISLSGNAGTLDISGSTFSENEAYTNAVLHQSLGAGKVTISDSTFNSNTAVGTSAVGLYGVAEVKDSKFLNNEATTNATSYSRNMSSAALFVGADANVKVDKTEFNENKTGIFGGAIATRLNVGTNGSSTKNNLSNAKLDITNSTFTSNEAGTYGGAIANTLYGSNTHDGFVTVDKSTFTSNKAGTLGGAIYNSGDTDLAGNKGAMYISDSTFTNNTATENGGAIYNGGTLTLAGENTFSGNTANGVANDIHNVGTLNINGNTEFDGGITGAGTVNLGASSVINFVDEEVSGTSVLTAKDLTITDGAKFMLDWGDTINVSNSITGAVKISDLFIEGSKLTDGGMTTLFTDKAATIDTGDILIYGADGKYTVALDDKKLVLSKNTETNSLAAAIDDTKAETLFSFSGSTTQNISTASETGVDVGNLNIIGDHSTADTNKIELQGGKAIAVASGHTLKVVDTKIVDANDTKIDYTVNNNGSAELKDSTVDKINNAGTLSIEYGKDTNIDTKLTGTTGTTTLNTDKNVNWDIKNGVTQASLTFTGSGHVTLKTTDSDHKTIVGNIINSMTGSSLEIDGAEVSGNVTNNETGHMIWTENTALTGNLTNNGLFDIKNGNNFVLNATGIAADEGKGTLNIGDDTNVAIVDAITNNAPISQNAITIASKGTLKANAGQVTVTATGNTLTNDGTYIVKGGADADNYVNNALKVSGSGKTQVTGFVTQNAAIESTSTDADALSIGSGAGLQIKGGDLLANTTNAGTLSVTAGTISKAIAGVGTLKTADGVAIGNNVDVTQGTLDVTGTLTNDGTLTVNGNIAGTSTPKITGTTGTVNLKGGTSADAMATNAAAIDLNKVNVGGFVNNTGSITANYIEIGAGNGLKTNASNISLKEGSAATAIINEGDLELTGGTIKSTIDKNTSTTSKIIVSGDVNFANNTVSTNNAILINGDGAKLTAVGENIDNNVTNNVTQGFVLTGGAFTKGISGTGSTVIQTANATDTVTFSGTDTIAQDVDIIKGILAANSKTFNPNTDIAISENGTLQLNGGSVSKDIIGYDLGTGNTYGKLNVTGSSTINNAVVNELDVASGQTLTTTGNVTVNETLGNLGTITIASEKNLTLNKETEGAVTNAGTISGAGTLVIGDGDEQATSLTNSGTISSSVNIKSDGTLTTATSGLTTSSDIANDGKLIFNNSADGTIAQNITKSTAGTGTGIVEIAATDGKTISLGDKTITNNSVKLSSGIFDVGTASGNVDVSGMNLIANGGTLSVQDDSIGNITLGTVNTDAAALNVKIDANFTGTPTAEGITGTADKIVSSSVTTETNKIQISDIKVTADPVATVFKAQIADTASAGAVNVTATTLSGASTTIGGLKFTYENGWLTGEHSTLSDAITSSIGQKLYAMGDNEAINGPLTLGGTSLSITGNDKTISSTTAGNDGIKTNGNTLSITGATIGSTTNGFGTAIDNATVAGGTVNLKDVTMTGNTTDVANAGTLNLDGTNSINTITDAATPTGTTTVKGGTSTIGSLVQKAVSILSGGTLNIAADKLSTTDGTDNAGTLNLSAGDTGALASAITDSQTDKTGVTNIAGNVSTNGHNIEQATVNVGSDGSTAPVPAALTVAAGDTVTTSGDINVNNLSSVTAAADSLIAEGTNGIANAGTLNLNGSTGTDTPLDTKSVVTGAGTTNLNGNIAVKENITQGTVNIGNNSPSNVDNTSGSMIQAANEIVVESGSALDTNADRIKTAANKYVTNKGNLTLNGAAIPGVSTSVDAAIRGDGTTNIEGNVTLGRKATQGTINIADDAELTNNKEINAGTINVNDGTLKNNAKILSSGTDPNTNTIVVGDDGNLINGNNTDGYVATTVIGANINNAGTVTNYSHINENSTITNTGDLNNKAVDGKDPGKISGAIDNEVGGTVNNEGLIIGAITNAGSINNDGTLGSNANITNDGNGASVTNKGTISSAITNKTGVNNVQIANAGTIKGDVNNGDGANNVINNSITEGGVTKQGEIKGNVVNAAGTVNTQADKIATGTGKKVTNDGTVNLTGSDDPANPIALSADIESITDGKGTTNIAGDVSSAQDIAQKTINVGNDGTSSADGSLTNTGDIVAETINVTTNGTLNQNDGQIGYFNNRVQNINNEGVTNITGGDVFARNVNNNSGDTNISGGSVTANAINNTAVTAGDDITITGGDVFAGTITNSGAGDLSIAQTTGGSVVADAITNSGDGATNIASTVNADKINATDGAVNVDAKADSVASTSDLLANKAGDGAAAVTIAEGAKVAVTTDNDSLVVDNNVDTTAPGANNGTLELKGNAPTPEADPHDKADSNDVGTQFSVDPNSIVNADIDLTSGQLSTDGSNINGVISAAANTTINAKDGKTSDVGNVNMANGAYVKTDVNAMTSKSDTFTQETGSEGNSKYLTDLGIQDLDKFAYDHKSINLTSGTGLDNLQMTDALKANLEKNYSSVLTPVRKMNARVSVDDSGNLMLNFTGTGNDYKDFNPAIMASPVAAQLGGFLVQLNSYDQAFNNMDQYMLMTRKQRQALKLRNKIAATEGNNIAYDPTMTQNDYAGGWFRPYASFEKVGLAGGPKVENNMYGAFVGGESSMKDLGNGWDGMWGAYIGYNGAHQNYDSVSMYENGGTLGLVGMAYKDNFFVGATINGGMMAGQADTMYGSEDFNMVLAGIAAKTGYNWELADGKFIIQPSLQTSYSFVNTFDYHNAANVYVDSDPLHAITLEPGIKFIGNLKNGWQPYAGISAIFNIMDRTHFHANDVNLPNLSVSPYAKYGIGVRKTWGERFSGFFQMFVMSGGRNGFGMQGGFKWAIGANGTGHISKDAKNPELKKTTINLQNKKASVK